ncbi:hypothetical protein J6590_085119 [Homalodisca vitripennis]|nr:hypothetical protein J6590_085119 [Homalodisca vitripennis]
MCVFLPQTYGGSEWNMAESCKQTVTCWHRLTPLTSCLVNKPCAVRCEVRSLNDYTQFGAFKNIIESVLPDAKVIYPLIMGTGNRDKFIGPAAARVVEILQQQDREGGRRGSPNTGGENEAHTGEDEDLNL